MGSLYMNVRYILNTYLNIIYFLKLNDNDISFHFFCSMSKHTEEIRAHHIQGLVYTMGKYIYTQHNVQMDKAFLILNNVFTNIKLMHMQWEQARSQNLNRGGGVLICHKAMLWMNPTAL